MLLHTRMLRADDFSDCWPLLSNQYAFTPAMAKVLPDAWRHLLAVKAMRGAVVEHNSRIVAFGASVFVRHSWVREFLADPTPHAPMRALCNYRNPGSPILRQSQIARVNASSGLTLLVVHHGTNRNMEAGCDYLSVQQALMDGYVEVHKGYQLRKVFNEVYGEFELEWTLSGGNHELARSYEDYYESHRLSIPVNRPYLAFTSRERAALSLATLTSQMFRFTPPRIGFGPKHQELLDLALEGKGDRDLAALLGITEDAVARRWRSIYRLSEKDPQVQREFSLAEAGLQAPSTRKRYILLNILRERKEEIRPWHWPTARRYGWSELKSADSLRLEA